MGGPENGNFPLLYVVKVSLRRWVGGSEKPQTPLRNIKMAPYYCGWIVATFQHCAKETN